MAHKNGFTLVEVIVVSVLVVLLSTVATVLYNGYIQDSAQTAVKTLAETAAASANSYYLKTSVHPDSAKLDLFLPDATKYTVTIDTTNGNITIAENKYGKTATVSYR